ncbi:hypothetical protein BDR03DRAFT_950131 [Suillus americanus]|nr:hypothetical protein BDR03DRAFT_950131 [Suillus americanus]
MIRASLFHLVTNPQSFPQSVEKLFRISFGTGPASAIVSAGLFQCFGLIRRLRISSGEKIKYLLGISPRLVVFLILLQDTELMEGLYCPPVENCDNFQVGPISYHLLNRPPLRGLQMMHDTLTHMPS